MWSAEQKHLSHVTDWGPTRGLLNQILHFNNVSRQCLCWLKLGRHYANLPRWSETGNTMQRDLGHKTQSPYVQYRSLWLYGIESFGWRSEYLDKSYLAEKCGFWKEMAITLTWAVLGVPDDPSVTDELCRRPGSLLAQGIW